MVRYRQRKSREKSKRIILLALEGSNKTEKIYFHNFQDRGKNFIIKIVPGNETDSVSLVEQTIKYIKKNGIDLSEDDIAYCIFDTDVNLKKDLLIAKAITKAEQHKIVPIVSSPCIELWFLLHFDYTTARLNNDEVCERLKKFCSKYSKSYNIFPELVDKLSNAITNSKKLEKEQIKNGYKLRTVEANPYTEVYKIVEELIK